MQPDSYAVLLDREEEAAANVYVLRAIAVAEAFFAVCFTLNEIGIFEVGKSATRIAFAVTVVFFGCSMLAAKMRHALGDRRFKYYLLALTLLLTLFLTVLLPSYTAPIFLFPLLLTAQYRSGRLAALATSVSCLLALFSPVLAYLLHTYSLSYLTGYLETVAGVSLSVSEVSAFTAGESVRRILLYLGLPQMLVLLSLCGLIFAIVKGRNENHLRRLEVADLNMRLTKQLKVVTDVQDSVLVTMAQLIESRDSNTGGHVHRAAYIVQKISEAMLHTQNSGMTEELAENMVKAAPLHDLGKIAIDDSILRKPGPLTAEEWSLIKKHPADSAHSIEQVFRGTEDLNLTRVAVNMAFYHHERMDGSGYPMGLKGSEIPLEARIMAVADVLDAILSKRSYKEPVPFDKAFLIVEDEMRAGRLDIGLLPYLMDMKEEIRKKY